MKFKSGDVVIKTTGGNKMTICNIKNGLYKCLWFVGSSLNEKSFSEEELVTLEEYKHILKSEEREDKINRLLNLQR